MTDLDPTQAKWQKWSMRALLVALICVSAVLNYQLWVPEDRGVRQMQMLQAAIQAQQAENDILRQRNRGLEAEVISLKEGLDAIEERARVELGMISKDETFFRILNDSLPGSDPTADLEKTSQR